MRKILGLVMVSCFLLSGVLLAEETEANAPAVAAAQQWLAVIDKGDYATSWEEASAYFKLAVTRDQWAASLGAIRKSLGKLMTRAEKQAMAETSLPGAPDGSYVVIQFDSAFENKKVAIETVTFMLDKDGQWRAAGYFIK